MGHTPVIAIAIAVHALIFAPGTVVLADEAADFVLNGGGEQGKGDQPSIWLAAQVPADGLRMWRDIAEKHAGQASLAIANTHDYPQLVANNWAQDLQEIPAGKTLQLSAWVKTADADAANVCLQCWDKSAQTMLAFASTPTVRGDQEWTRMKSSPVVVPDETASIVVRAALGGKGKVWFDDVSVTLADASTSPRAMGLAPSAARPEGPPPAIVAPAGLDPALVEAVGGIQDGYGRSRIVAVRPIIRDMSVVAYLPNNVLGHVDNLGVNNSHGGSRAFFSWLPVPPQEAQAPNRRFYLAVYAREVRNTEQGGMVGVYPVQADWNEGMSWKTQPKAAESPISKAFVNPGTEEGWRLCDVTSLVRSPAGKPAGGNRGIMLRFEKEDIEDDYTQYLFVSREGADQWKAYRPVLLIVESLSAPAPQTQKTTEPPAKATSNSTPAAQPAFDQAQAG